MNLREAAMLVLEAIEQGEPFQYLDDVVAPALRLALATIQSEIKADKPAAWMYVDETGMRFVSVDRPHQDCVPLYTRPPGPCV